MRLYHLSLLTLIFCVVVTTSACSANQLNALVPTSQTVPQYPTPGAYNTNGSYFEVEPIAPAFNPPKFYRTGYHKIRPSRASLFIL